MCYFQADVCSYLQLISLVESIQLESDDVKTLYKVTKGDMRQCLLQLELWANSGGGWPTENERQSIYRGCITNMFGLQSVTPNYLLQLFHEEQLIEVRQPIIESWRTGFPLLYSNLELLLLTASSQQSFSVLDKIMYFCTDRKVPSCDSHQMNITDQYSRFAVRSRLSRKKSIPSVTTTFAQMCFPQTGIFPKSQCSADEKETTNSLGALADFFDLMSVIDASLPLAQKPVPQCQRVDFAGTGAKILDGQLDEIMEEETDTQEILLDIVATLEVLGFHRCKNLSKGDASWKTRSFPALSGINKLCFITCHLCPHLVHQRRFELYKKVLNNEFFSLLHNKHAACTDYLPLIRLICRSHKKQQNTEELLWCFTSFRTQLGLSKRTAHLLAGDFA